MTKAKHNQVLRVGNVLPKILGLLPRIGSIIKNIRFILAMKGSDKLSLGTILEENAKKYPNKPALLFEDVSYTHAAFNAIINQHANYFLAQGVQRGDVVVVFLENRPELVFMIAAMAKIGGVASLINAKQREEVLKHSILVDLGDHIVVGEELVDAFESVRSALNLPASVQLYQLQDTKQKSIQAGYKDLKTLVQEVSNSNPPITKDIQTKERYANVFTSGTTGLPKASVQTSRRWLNCLYWFGKVNVNLNSNDVMYISIPFFHTNALIVAWPTAAAAGAAIAMRRKFSVSNFWSDIRKFNASSFIYIGEICRYLMNNPLSDQDRNHRVRVVIGNGLRPDIWMEFKKRFGINRVVEFYGSADGTSSFTNTLNLDYTVGWCPSEYAIVQYDKEEDEPVRNIQGFMEKVPKGESGLLLTRITDSLPFYGYTNKKENEKKIFTDVFETGDQWYNTGDMMRDIGFKHAQFVDRLGDTFRWKGENVSTAEVESIINAHPDVENSCVYGVKLPHTDGRAGMVAIIPQKEVQDFDFDGFLQYMKTKLPPYAVPLVIRFTDSFELTATHKIKKFNFKKEGIAMDVISDPLYVLLPGVHTYRPVEQEVYAAIQEGSYGF